MSRPASSQWPRQDRQLAPDGRRIPGEVAGVGVEGHQAERAALARAAHEDGDVLLDRPRVADRLGDRHCGPLERRCPRAPHEGKQLQGVLEQAEALGHAREPPAVAPVLLPPPGGAEAAYHPALAQHVGGGDDLGQMRRVPQCHPGDEGPEPDRACPAGQPGERRPGLGDVLPDATDLGDLHHVVHQPDAREPDALGDRGHLGQPLGEGGAAPGPRERRELQAEPQGHGIRPLAGGGDGGVEQGRRHDLDRLGPVHTGEALAGQSGPHPAGRRQLGGQGLGRHRARAGPVAGPAHLAGRVEHDRVTGHARAGGEGHVRRPAVSVETERVEHRQQTSRQPPLQDQVEDGEGVGARPLVVLGRADQGPESVGRHDLVGSEVGRGPVGLPGAGRPDQDDEAGRGEAHVRVWPTAKVRISTVPPEPMGDASGIHADQAARPKEQW